MDKYYALKLDVGVTADGNLEPLHQIGVALAVPIMVGKEIGEATQTVYISPADTLGEHDVARIVPGTRLLHVRDPRVEQAILATGNFVETDKPTKKQVADEAKSLTAAAEESGTHNGDPDPTNPDNPVIETTTEG